MLKNLLKVIIFISIVVFLFVNLVFPIYYSSHVEKYSQEFNVNKYLVYSIIKAESNFNKNASSDKGAKGLMQILDKTGEEVFTKLKINKDNRNLFNPQNNIMVGTYYISYLLERYNNDEIKAIAAYNSGMTNVDTWAKNESDEFLNNIEFGETKKYVETVSRNKVFYELIYGKLNLGWMALPDVFATFKVFIRDIFKELRKVLTS